MAQTLEEALFHISGALQAEVANRLLEIIKSERKRRSVWRKIKRFLSSIRRCKTGCITCECEEPPPQVIPEAIRVTRSPDGDAHIDRCSTLDRAHTIVAVTDI